MEKDLEKRYRRQLILGSFGEDKQKQLMQSKVLLVGAGGLGSPVAYYLVAAGIGKITIVDDDIVDISNLQRQILHTTSDVGISKVASAKDKLIRLNPYVDIETYRFRFNENNMTQLSSDYDLVINAVDNIETRYLLNRLCYEKQIPLIEGAIHGFMGHVMSYIPGQSACYNCIFPNQKKSAKEEIGVIGSAVGVIGTLQATEAIKILTGVGKNLANVLLSVDMLTMSFTRINVSNDNSCKVCGRAVG